MSHSSSKTWMSEPKRHADRHRHLMANVERVFGYKTGAMIPLEFKDYIQHLHDIQVDRLKAKQRELQRRTTGTPAATQVVVPAFGGKVATLSGESRSSVLAETTTWSVNYPESPRAHAALWPSRAESGHEGDGRAKTGFKRKLPLVRWRFHGNDTVIWKCLPVIEPYFFDDVCRPPTYEKLYTPTQQIRDEESLLNKDLLDALDDDTIYRI